MIENKFYIWFKAKTKVNPALLAALLQKLVSNGSNRISIDDLPDAFRRVNLNQYLIELESLKLIVLSKITDNYFHFVLNMPLISQINK